MTRKRMNKKKFNPVSILIILLVAAALIWQWPAISGFIGSDDGTTPLLTASECSSETTPDLNIVAVDEKGAAITDAGIYRKEGLTAWTAFTPGTPLTGLEVGATYTFVPGIEAATFVDDTYGAMFEYTVKCKEVDSMEIIMFNDEIETSLSATFYNEDANAAAQTVLAADTPVVELRLRAGADEYFGNPSLDNPNVLVLRLNSSQWDRPNKVVVNGQTMSGADSMQRLDSAASFTDYYYELPVISDEKITVQLYLDADDTNAPSVDGTAYIYAGGYFVSDVDASIKTGVETEEGTAVGTDAADSVALDFTA